MRRRLSSKPLTDHEPLLSGIYNAEADRQSSWRPRFRDIEKRHGSLIKGMLAQRCVGRKACQSRRPDRYPLRLYVYVNAAASTN